MQAQTGMQGERVMVMVSLTKVYDNSSYTFVSTHHAAGSNTTSRSRKKYGRGKPITIDN